jgi:hypothetical protein
VLPLFNSEQVTGPLPRPYLPGKTEEKETGYSLSRAKLLATNVANATVLFLTFFCTDCVTTKGKMDAARRKY